MVENRRPDASSPSVPDRSPAKRVHRFGKGGRPRNYRTMPLAVLRGIPGSSDLVELRCPCKDLRPHPNRSPAQRVRFGKGGRSQRIWSFRGAYANRGNEMQLTSSDVVEAGGVEPPSENVSAGTSPCADGYCGPRADSPSGGQAVTPAGQVASLCMVRAKLSARTSATE